MELQNFLSSLIDKIYKVLPMYEAGDEGVFVYIERFVAELKGGMYTFPALQSEGQYISIINNLNYILHCQCSVEECRRQTFDSISLAKKIKKNLEDYHGES